MWAAAVSSKCVVPTLFPEQMDMLESIDSPQGGHVKRIAPVTSRWPWSREWGRVVRGSAGSKVEVDATLVFGFGIGVEPSTSTKYGGTGTP